MINALMLSKLSNLLIITAALFIVILFSNCKKDSSSPLVEPTTIILGKTTAKPLEIVTILTNKAPEANNTVVSFNDQSVGYSIAGSHISFMVPQNTNAGTYTLAVTTLGEDNNFTLQVENAATIADVDGYITDLLNNTDQERTAFRDYQDTLLSIGLLDSSDVLTRRQFWDNINVQNQQRLAQMTADEKAYYVQLYDANKGWIENITADLVGFSAFKNGSTSECIGEYREALQYFKNANAWYEKMKAYWKAYLAYRCLINEKAARELNQQPSEELSEDKNSYMSKAKRFWDNLDLTPSFAGPLLTVANQAMEKVGLINQEVSDLGTSAYIAEEVEDVQDYKTQNVVDFCNGYGVKFYMKVRYRSIQASDANTNAPYAAFAKYYSNYITSYDALVAAITDPTIQDHMYIYRPGFVNTTQVREMNRFLSVPPSSVSNDKAILINTQFENNDNDWVVIFATDEETEQSFSFNIDYDDGLVQLSKKVDGTVKECDGYDTFTDPRDGQIYNIVQIGNQVWFAENLNYTTGNSFCYDNNVSNCDTYGRLYDWQTALTACPVGWHLPSDAEWTVLRDYLGGASVAGGKLKSTGTQYWQSPNTGATNESGFAALPGGNVRTTNGLFLYIGTTGGWWSSTEYDALNARSYSLNNRSDYFGGSYADKIYGFSCRCLRD